MTNQINTQTLLKIEKINQRYTYQEGQRGIQDLLANIVGAYIIFEVHRQSLYANHQRNYVDLDIYYNSAHSLMLQIRSFINPTEKNSGLKTVFQIGNLNIDDFIDFNRHKNRIWIHDENYNEYIENFLKEIRDVKSLFDRGEGSLYEAHQLVKEYETLEFHLDKTPEKELTDEKFLNKFNKLKCNAILEKIDDILLVVEFISDSSYKYDDTDIGLPCRRILLDGTISGYVKSIHKRIGRAGTNYREILKLVNKRLSKTLKYLHWQEKDRRRIYGPLADPNDKHNSSDAFEDLSKNKQDRAVQWCKDAFIEIKSINQDTDSYALKHIYESCGLGYIGNGAFKGAMLKAGFRCQDESELNWEFNISAKSPALFIEDQYKLPRRVSGRNPQWIKKLSVYVDTYVSKRFILSDGVLSTRSKTDTDDIL